MIGCNPKPISTPQPALRMSSRWSRWRSARSTRRSSFDMQHDFIAPGGLVGRSGRDVTAAQKLSERLPAFIATARRAGVLVVFVRNVYSTERNLYLVD
jgi:hypothetical protein